MLTKSLHTITAVANVAKFYAQTHSTQGDAVFLASKALSILGYQYTVTALRAAAQSDETLARCVAACARVLAGE
jgi:hypothetical protein